jgi:hypothetical protein
VNVKPAFFPAFQRPTLNVLQVTIDDEDCICVFGNPGGIFTLTALTVEYPELNGREEVSRSLALYLFFTAVEGKNRVKHITSANSSFGKA